MNIEITVKFEAIDEDDVKVITGERAGQIASKTAEIIGRRLVGEGFLPDDVTLGQFEITTKVD